MIRSFAVKVGPIGFRLGADWRAPVRALERLYRSYPTLDGAPPDFTIRLEATRPWRRWVRPSIRLAGDYQLPGAAPLPLSLGLLAAEMGMNLQLALGCRRFLLLHAGVVERDGQALILTGESGSGKSTLAALLSTQGWRFLADEFALIDLTSGCVHPFPRPVSLKNESVALLAGAVDEERLGPWLRDTPKGDIRHLIPDADALARMDEPARPVMVLFPRYGAEAETRPVPASELFVRLTQASTNYVALGEAGFRSLVRLARDVPALAVDYPDTASALAQVELLWRMR